MPIISGLTNLQTRASNVVMARAFFPRAKEWLYPRLCGSYTSTSKIEPFSALGSIGGLKRFNGQLRFKNLPSYSMNVPNLLFKNASSVEQSQYEFDQTGTVVQLSQALGLRLAEFPDQLFCSRLLKASNYADVSVSFEGQSYTITLDGKPYFAVDHPTYDGGVQSNIIQGGLPHSVDAVGGQDYATLANLMLRDLTKVVNHFRTVKDTAGFPLYPTIDLRKNVVVVVPPVLEPIAALAFRTGTNSVINQTTNVASMFVRDVISSGYLAGFSDPDNEGLNVVPINETDWYVFIVDDFIKPFYVQLFRPQRADERFPVGFTGGEADVNKVVREMGGITVDQATVFASTRVDTTFQKIGANADAWTIENDAFILSARYRGNMVYGPWMTGVRIIPSGGDISDQDAGGESSSSSSSSNSETSESSSSSESSVSSVSSSSSSSTSSESPTSASSSSSQSESSASSSSSSSQA